jgi:hypothetical protein
LYGHLNLFCIEPIAPQCSKIKLKTLAGEAVDITHFAETAKSEFTIAFRVLFLPEFSMARGMIFPFAADKEG